jgi:hypothetical protein
LQNYLNFLPLPLHRKIFVSATKAKRKFMGRTGGDRVILHNSHVEIRARDVGTHEKVVDILDRRLLAINREHYVTLAQFPAYKSWSADENVVNLPGRVYLNPQRSRSVNKSGAQKRTRAGNDPDC